jgi:lipopolysaccharide transport system ATP-binding protein
MEACLVPGFESAQKPTAVPTLFHVTHPKAGSQWIHAILRQCAEKRLVQPAVNSSHFFKEPIQPGRIYPTVYTDRQQFDLIAKPDPWRCCVVVRDPRDALISGYFSLKVSHLEMAGVTQARGILQQVDREDGLLLMLDDWLPAITNIQLSWLESGERLIRYEDLLVLDLEILIPLLLDEWELDVSRERAREVILANRFEAVTGRRPRGNESITAHERKGQPGDWRNYFTPRVTRAFKRRFGGLLVALEYERDLNW